MTKPKSVRLREQRQRQQAYRDEQKKARRPGRDDIARVALRLLIVGAASVAELEGNPRRMNLVEDAILKALNAQGFDPRDSDRVLGDLIDKYVGGWGFRQKPHLQPQEQKSA